MKNYKNNHRRNRYRNNGDRSFHKNGGSQKLNSDFGNNPNFRRRNPGRNNQNASKLIEKYSNLAREALSNGDKILYEDYLQHADHFIRILSEKEIIKNNSQTNLEQVNKNHTSEDNNKEIVEKNDQETIELNTSEN